MKLRTLIAAMMFAIAGSAFAMHCPMDMKKIDEALAKKPETFRRETCRGEEAAGPGRGIAQGRQTPGIGGYAGQGNGNPGYYN